MEEEKVYNNLRANFQKNNIRNTLVINGWKDQPTKRSLTGESDFLIVSEPYQTIFHVEVKKTYSESNCDKAAEQLARGLKLIQATIPFPEEEKWKYVRMMYFGFDNQNKTFQNNNACSTCKQFVFGPSEDIWAEVSKAVEKPGLANPSNKTNINILKFLLFNMFKQECGATTKQLIKETRKTSDAMTTMKNILFWSKEQLNVINATRETKRMAFASEFGTGKTVLLKAKARELLGVKEHKESEKSKNLKKQEKFPQSHQYNQKVVIAIFEGTTADIALKLEYEKQFQNTGAQIIGIQGIDGL